MHSKIRSCWYGCREERTAATAAFRKAVGEKRVKWPRGPLLKTKMLAIGGYNDAQWRHINFLALPPLLVHRQLLLLILSLNLGLPRNPPKSRSARVYTRVFWLPFFCSAVQVIYTIRHDHKLRTVARPYRYSEANLNMLQLRHIFLVEIKGKILDEWEKTPRILERKIQKRSNIEE